MVPKALIGALTGLALAGFAASQAFAEEEQPYMVVSHEIPEYLPGAVPGDVAAGRKTAITKSKGNCLACHTMPIPEQSDHGLTGPGLTGVGSRMTEG
ncbi:MAG: hypothetical protein OQK23_04630, partial [Rhodospirillales bacterium]|nr:hypothetical protein [Rhodospirillales bacterium]